MANTTYVFRSEFRSRIRVRWLVWFVSVAMVALTSVVVSPAPATAAPTIFASLFKSMTSGGRCLDADADTEGNVRTNVQLYFCRSKIDSGVDYQEWTSIGIPYQPDDVFKLRNWATSKCLTYAPGAGHRSPVWVENCDRPGQGWRLREVGIVQPFTIYQLVAVETADYCLDVVDPEGGFRSGIDLWQCSAEYNWVRWRYGSAASM